MKQVFVGLAVGLVLAAGTSWAYHSFGHGEDVEQLRQQLEQGQIEREQQRFEQRERARIFERPC